MDLFSKISILKYMYYSITTMWVYNVSLQWILIYKIASIKIYLSCGKWKKY